MPKYKLKEGVVLHPSGKASRIDNTNLTDELAEYFLQTGKATADQFEVEEGIQSEQKENKKNKNKHQ